MSRWTRAQVEKFAPDAASVKAAQKLARPGPWSETGSTDTLVWGKCQGSGKTPYQVSVDLTGPAAKCSCPSRKFPCKHGVALLLLWVAGDGSVADMDAAAGFAQDWAQGRADKAATKAAKAQSSTPPDPEAQAKRLERRLKLMDAGIDEFETWLTDLYRAGFAAARQRPYDFWESPAARLVDAQLPGLAQRVRDVSARLYEDDWADGLLAETGRWFTALGAWRRRDALGEADLANVRTYLGWPVPTDEVRARTPLTEDSWLVEGLHRTDDGRLQSQRTWLRGTTSGERLLLLDFASGAGALPVAQTSGTLIEASLTSYPGSGVRRGLFLADPTASTSASTLPKPLTMSEAMRTVTDQMATNPFTDHFPVCIRASLCIDDESGAMVDDDGQRWPLTADVDLWPLAARCGDVPLAVFGEIEREGFRPLTVELDQQLIPV